MSPAIWLFSWLSFQVPTKGFCAAAVATAAMQVNQPITANSNGLALIGGSPLLWVGLSPKPDGTQRRGVYAIRAFPLFGCFLSRRKPEFRRWPKGESRGSSRGLLVVVRGAGMAAGGDGVQMQGAV